MRIRRVGTAAIAIVISAVAAPLFAGNCSWNTPPALMNFGSYSPVDKNPTPASAPTGFSFRCTPNQWARITVTPVSVPYRNANGAQYNIYLDGAGTQIWGDGVTGGTYDVYNSTPQNKDFNDSMYGIMPALQDLVPGATYTATVSVQLSYATSQSGPWTPVGGAQILTVTITVISACRVDAFDLTFPNYDPFAPAALNQTSTVKVYCSRNVTAFGATLDTGVNANGGQRRMLGGGQYLNYAAVFTGATGGPSSSSLVPIAGGFPILGTIPAGQDVPVGTYYDSLQATVNY